MEDRNHRKERPRWFVKETRVRGNAAVLVSELPLKVPRYSFKIGNVEVDEETDDIRVGSRLSIFNGEDAVELLREVVREYVDKREARIDELEEKKSKKIDEMDQRRKESSDD